MCLKRVSPECPSLKCGECGHVYHVGKCSGTTKAAFKAMTGEVVRSWQCATCKIHNTRQFDSTQDVAQGSGSGAESPSSSGTNVQTLLASMNQQLGSVLSRIEAIEKSIEVQSTKHTSILSKLEKQEKTNDDIARAIEMFSEKYDELLKKVDSSNKTIEALQKRTRELEARLACKDEELEELRGTVSALEQYSRNKNVEIHGVAQNDREDILDVVRSVATKLDLEPPSKDDIEAAHRLNAPVGKIAPIIIKFREREMRDRWISKRKDLKGERIFINENLSRQMKKLRWCTKQAAKEKGYQFVWVQNGRILVRQKAGTPIIRVESERDLAKLK